MRYGYLEAEKINSSSYLTKMSIINVCLVSREKDKIEVCEIDYR